jgi:hypothetical protein
MIRGPFTFSEVASVETETLPLKVAEIPLHMARALQRFEISRPPVPVVPIADQEGVRLVE